MAVTLTHCLPRGGAREFCPKQSSTSSELKVQSGELYETDK